VSLRHRSNLRIWARGAALAAASVLACGVVWPQYPGQMTKDPKKSPELRAVAVLEWTGDLGKPKACRIVPVTVLDQGQLQDGGVYLARPEPMALAGEVEYELEKDGKTIGLFDIENSGQEQGSWVGYGKWKPMPGPPKPKPVVAKIDDTEDDDKPVLHRKKHAGDANGGSASGSSGSSSAGSGAGSSTTGNGSGSSTASNEPSDPDRPVLHKHTDDSATASSGSGADAPDRPKIKKDKKQAEDEASVESLPDVTDPDRPRLKRGKSNDSGPGVLPSLMGLPQDMEQAVAVSDVKSRPDHPWTYSWASPDDEAKMKAQLEDVARAALGLSAPPAKAPKKTTAAKTGATHKSLKPAPEPEPAPLADEQFRVFELAYGSGATLVLTAHTDGPKDKMKFVTLIAQPDLYGNLLVLFKSVTDGAHLDETPRMRLIDAVDAMADNRGELLFELRGDTQRQFALFRVLRGQAEKLFVTGGGEIGLASN
jgi:hypothetical protein